MLGFVLAVVTALRIMIQYNGIQNEQTIKIAYIVGVTLMATAMIAEIMGCVLPMLAKRLKLDPAIMASPLITTVVDLCSMLVFFTIATNVMGI